MTETLHISCAGLADSQFATEYSAYWRVTYPSNDVAATTITDDEKKVTKYYLTNTDGDHIDNYKKDDIIIVNIETENRIGDNITFSLDDAEFDFEHSGSILPNNTFSTIIGSDLEQVELKVITQKNNN